MYWSKYLPRLFLLPFFLAVIISCSILLSRKSCFFTSISSVSRSFCIASAVVGAGASFLPPKTFAKKLIIAASFSLPVSISRARTVYTRLGRLLRSTRARTHTRVTRRLLYYARAQYLIATRDWGRAVVRALTSSFKRTMTTETTIGRLSCDDRYLGDAPYSASAVTVRVRRVYVWLGNLPYRRGRESDSCERKVGSKERELWERKGLSARGALI